LWKRAHSNDSELSEAGPSKKVKPSFLIDSKLLEKSAVIKRKHSLPVVTKKLKGNASKKRKILPKKVIRSSSEDTSETNDSVYHYYTSSSSSSDSHEDERVIKRAKYIRKKFFK
jgi:hypothetical protein